MYIHSSVSLRANLSSLTWQAATSPSGKIYRPININHYATKKSAAQSMLDVALLMANSSQLKTILYVGPQYRFYIPLLVLLSVSISLQVVVGLLLVFIGKSLKPFALPLLSPPLLHFKYSLIIPILKSGRCID